MRKVIFNQIHLHLTMSKSYVTLRLKHAYSYNFLKSKLIRPLPPDLLICGHDGYGQKIHSALLVYLSPKFSSWCEAVRDNGHNVNNFLIPTMDRLGIECLHDLLYIGYFRIDDHKVEDLITQISQIDLAFTIENQEGDQIGDIGNKQHHNNDHHLINEASSNNNNTDGMMNVILPNSPDGDYCDDEPLIKSSPNSTPPLYSENNSDLEGLVNSVNSNNGGYLAAINGNEESSSVFMDNESIIKSLPKGTTNKNSYGPRLADGRYKCSHCDKTFANSRNRKEHILALHLGHTLPCPKCGAKFRHRSTLRGHLLKHPRTKSEPISPANVDTNDNETHFDNQT